MLVDSTGIGPPTSHKSNEQNQNLETSQKETDVRQMVEDAKEETSKDKETTEGMGTNQGKREEGLDKSPGRTRTKSNQRWMKLRTTVQLSGAITSTNQKSKPGLKREDSFLKRFSTRQIPETQETVDTGDDTETINGSQTHNEVTRRRRKRRKELSKTVVNPDENFYFYWLMTVTICVLYNLWTLIVRQSFPELQNAANAFWYSGDGFTDFIFVCDIVVQFRTGYLEQGLMVYDSKKLATHYLKSRAFILDLLSLLPLDFLQLNFGVNPILRFPRFLKIYRIYNYYYMVESRTVYPNLWRVVNLIHILLILAHWFGCFYYLLSEAEGFQGDWVYPYRPGDYATLTRKYLGSLYWSTLTLTTIGDLPTPETNAEFRGRSKAMTSSRDPNIVPRRGHKSRLLQFNSNYGYLFTIISYLIGVFIFATIVGQVGNVITNRNANRLEFERLLDGAKTYMRHHKVPGGMKRRVLRWYDYSWSRGRIQGGGDINTALGLLPDKLKTELALHVNLSVLKKVTIFQECQPEFLHDLVLKMKAYIFTPGDLICRKGEVAREMFIIADGILDVISETGRVLTTMKAGDFFGEIGILNLDGLNKRTADVRSVGYSELFSLSREDVLTAMKDYPEAQEILQNLGRKRLMEAKNASKIHKAQSKQAKDHHDSSGDSDNAGKRIVEKLRSDVKGLKNVLRRSRRGTRTKNGLDGFQEMSARRTSEKKHSILRRMSHVQSSDEFEGNSETIQTPIGVGLPLLQRLKCLKEKQDKEKEEKEKLKLCFQSQGAKDESEIEPIGVGLPLTQRLKLLKQKEEAATAAISTGATVRTQQTGVRFDKSVGKPNIIISPKNEEDKFAEYNLGKEDTNNRDSVELKRNQLLDKLKLGTKDKNLPLKTVKDFEAFQSPKSTLESTLETSSNVPVINEAENSVPKSLGNKLEVPKSKDGWKILKKSSLTGSRVNKSVTTNNKNAIKKQTKRGTYLSKSDTILEKQKTFEKEEEKRSRSISPSDNYLKHQELTKQVDEKIMSEDEITRCDVEKVKIWPSKDSSKSPLEKETGIKKYDSISDLSPEYSGLPFVKKLKILNERQKLAELEKELLVRSASLDMPDRRSFKHGNLLIRSQSEASTIEIKKEKEPRYQTNLQTKWEESTSKIYNGNVAKKLEEEKNLRELKLCRKDCSEESIASPESNETIERRHLKSILKKLSAEGSLCDENQTSSKECDSTDLKKLLRAPTIEGYAARHKKLTKSVTFDSDTLASPPESENLDPAGIEDAKTKGISPLSPTAILTLQLSNLSMIPLINTKITDKKNIKEKPKEEKLIVNNNKEEREMIIAKIFEKLQETEIIRNLKLENENVTLPYSAQEFDEKNFPLLPFTKSLFEKFFGEILDEIQKIIRGILVEMQEKFQLQFDSLEGEVKRRDDIIHQLQTKLQKLEEKKSGETTIFSGKMGSLEIQADDNETNVDYPDSPFLRGDSFATILDCDPLIKESHHDFTSPVNSAVPKENRVRFGENETSRSNDLENAKESNLPLNSSGKMITYREMKSNSKTDTTECNLFKNKISVFSEDDTNFSQRHLRRTLDTTSDEEVELSDLPRFSRPGDVKRRRNKHDFKFKKNFSFEETQMQYGSNIQKHWNLESKWEEENGKLDNRARGRLIDHVTKFQRSYSCSHDKDFVALDIDDDSTSSDVESFNNKDWEVQMLVEELEKKESTKRGSNREVEHWISEAETKIEENEDVIKLQEEVNTLKKMVCESDLTRLTNSELDMLETIIEAKDKKISQIAKSNSLDHEDKIQGHGKLSRIYTSDSDNKLEKLDQRKKPTLRQKIGQALSFDFHDIESRKSKPEHSKNKSFLLRKQKSVSSSYQERQILHTLWHTSSLLRNRVIEDPAEVINQASSSGNAGSSLPILISGSLSLEKNSDIRTSLPTLSAKSSNFVESLTGSATTSESDFKQSCDSVFEKPEVTRTGIHVENRKLLDSRNINYPSTSGMVRLTKGESNSSLNNFIKSVGEKVKQAMAGDISIIKNQVPTISKLCDEQSILKEMELGCSEEFGDVSKVLTEDEPKPIDNENTFDCHPKSDPPDL